MQLTDEVATRLMEAKGVPALGITPLSDLGWQWLKRKGPSQVFNINNRLQRGVGLVE